MKTSIPWLRVFVEGAVIVGSILLAFGIDAWWEGRQEDERIVQSLIALHGEFQAVLEHIDGDYARRNQRTEAYRWILEAISEGRTVDDDSLATRIGLMTGMARFVAPHAVYDDLVASGDLRRLEPDLRAALLAYAEQVDRLDWAETRQNSAYFEGVYPYLLESADWLAMGPNIVWEDITFEPTHASGLDELLADRQFQNLLVSRLRDLAFSQRSTEELREIVDEVLTLLENHFD